jgi:hypothetical protein
VSRPAPFRSLLVVALALGIAPASAAAQDPAALVEAAIPQDSAISEQYQRVQEVLDEAAAAVPAPPPAEPPEPEPVATEAPAPEQYHSENVSVTQEQPSNVNVSIRINSPGDDGPVVQINNAGGSAVVEQVQQVVQRPEPKPKPAPEPAAPVGGDLPDTWEWVWTSACFGGGPSAGAASAGVPGWSWRWSCEAPRDEDDPPFMPAPDELLGPAGDVVGAAQQLVAAVAPPPVTAPAAPAPRERADRRAAPSPRASTDGRAHGPPASGTGGGPGPPTLARPLLAAATTTGAAKQVRHAVRAAARARPGDPQDTIFPPGGDGPALGAATALGTVASLLLGIWIAVLVTACVLVIPRLRRRRWSGLAWRLTRLPSSRLERPG